MPQRYTRWTRVNMIQLTRLNGNSLLINSDLIKLIETTPDTIISLVNGEKIVVRESGEEILELIVQFRRRILDGLEMNCSGRTSMKAGPAEGRTKEPLPEEH